MMKQLKKALSILCAIALLISGMAALAEEPATEQTTVEETVIEQPAAEQPAEEPAEEPAAEESAPVVEESAPAVEEPVVEEPAPVAEEPAAEEPAEEPVVEEPAVEEPQEVIPSEAEESPAEEPAAEEPAVDESAKEEFIAEVEADDEEASDNNNEETPAEDDDGLEELDDGWGYIDAEVISENVPEMTDEFKGLRTAEMTVGQVLSDTLEFGQELTVTLKGVTASTVLLKLYASNGTSINTKVDGKAVGFTPAESDIPSTHLYTYELTNAAGQTHEIVLSSLDTVSFDLYAVEETVEPSDVIPSEVEESPSDVIPSEVEESPVDVIPTEAEESPSDETPAETPVPTIQASVKTYDALKVGNSISDTLVAGQKARIQVKCGKNPYVTLTLSADPDDAVVTLDGEAVQFTAAGNGTYTCDLDEVAFRKFIVMISAKQDLAFTLSAEARQGEAIPAPEEEEAAEEETSEEDIYNEETADEVTEEVTEEPTEEENTEEAIEEAETSAEENEGEEAVDEETITEEIEVVEPVIVEQVADIQFYWDEEVHTFGSVMHMQAELNEYDGMTYTLQWQYSKNGESWIDELTETA